MSALRSEYDALQQRLAARESIAHYAHAAISIFLGLVFAGGASKLFWDYQLEYLEVVATFCLLSFGLLTHAVARLSLGRRAMTREDVAVKQLTSLRAELGLDDPSVLLPLGASRFAEPSRD